MKEHLTTQSSVELDATRLQPLAYNQRALWFLQQMDPESNTYHVGFAVHLHSAIDDDALQRALQKVVDRHATLRTSYHTVNGEPLQHVHSRQRVQFEVIDTAEYSEEQIEETLRHFAERPFDLQRGPIFRSRLYTVSPEHSILQIIIHHIAVDAWSIWLIIDDLRALYEAETGPAKEPRAWRYSYADFVAWQEEMLDGEKGSQMEAFWREQLSGSPTPAAFPGDRRGRSEINGHGALHRFALDPELTDNLRHIARKNDCTLYEVLLTGLYILLHRYTEQTDLTVGSPVAGRSHARFARIVGYFINILPLRMSLDPESGFTTLLQEAAGISRQALAHQHYPFAALAEIAARAGRSTTADLVPVGLNFLRPPRRLHDLIATSMDRSGASEIEFGGVTVAGLDVDLGYGIGDIGLNFQFVELEDEVAGEVSYDTAQFDEPTVTRLVAHYQRILREAVDAPDRPVKHLPLLADDERKTILHDWNETAKKQETSDMVPQLIAARAAQSPHATAVEFEGTAISYGELNHRANQLAHLLRSRGVGPETLVAIGLQRSPEMIVALLAVLKAGGAFMPLDPEYPHERLAWMLADSAPAAVITDDHSAPHLPLQDAPPELDLVHLQRDAAAIAAQSDAEPQPAIGGENLAYAIYTSGTTGRPKGVMIEHQGLLNHNLAALESFDLRPEDRVWQFATISFDAALEEIFPTLIAGGTLVLRGIEPPAVVDLGPLLSEKRISVLNLPTAYWAAWVHALDESDERVPDTLRLVVIGGERAERRAYERWLAASAGVEVTLLNTYGPTETAIIATLYRSTGEETGELPIGRPLPNVRTYVLDSCRQPVPVGVPGELYIGGDGVGRGYLNRPDLTAARFPRLRLAANGEQWEERLYRTGDRVCYRADGNIDFLGRFDAQIKLRGYRIEPAEVEKAILRHSSIVQAAVVARAFRGDEQELNAYVVGGDRPVPPPDILRHFLSRILPNYMIPTRFVVLDHLPLTRSGKVDRRALPEPAAKRPALSSRFSAPATPLETELAQIWAAVLGLDYIGTRDNFFALGGHSLLATQIISRVERATGVTLPLRRLFAEPTVAEMARAVEEARESTPPTVAPLIEPAPRSEGLPLSFAQERMWFLHQLAPDQTAYLIPLAIRYRDPLDMAAFRRALKDLTARHESLRTRFPVSDGMPEQEVLSEYTVTVNEVDLSSLSAENREVALNRLLATDSAQTHDLAQVPPWRGAVLKLAEDEHVLYFNFHHIIFDQWSAAVFWQELDALYRTHASGEPLELSPMEIQYADFAAWQRRWLEDGALGQLLDYWRPQLADLPPLSLLTDFPRPPVQTYHGAMALQELPDETVDAIQDASRRLQVSPFMLLFAAFKLLLSRYSGQRDFAVGVPVANRHRLAVEPIIGVFVNTLVVRTDLSGDPSFAELLEQVRQTLLDTYAHQEMPFEKLVEEIVETRDLSRTPLIQVLFNMVNSPFERQRLAHTAAELPIWDRGAAQFDLTVGVLIDRDLPTDPHIVVEYNTDLYREDTMRRLLDHYQRLLESVVADPNRPVSTYPLLSATEEEQILYAWNETEMAYPRDRRLHDLVADQAARTPDAGAVTFGDETLTYEELDRRANQLAHHLLEKGVRPDDVVGVFVERSLEMVVALLGILKAGAAYLPLDPDFPSERLLFMVEDAGVEVVLTQERLVGVSPVTHVTHVIRLDSDWGSMAARPATAPAVVVPPESRAYLIYTSGSTGKPKGVQIEHRNVVNFIAAMQEAPGLAAEDVLLAVTTLSFDISILEIFLPLAAGARVVVADGQSVASGPALLETLRRYGATVMQATPTTWQMLVDAGWDNTPALRRALCGGEALPRDLANAILEREVELWNMYGPTETTIWSAIHRVQPGPEAVPIGRPIGNNTFYILDERGRPVPIGVAGELHIGGEGVARGYLNRPVLNEERFLPDSFTRYESTGRMYRTGDLARYLADGTVQYLGRMDFQVKLHGHRIELGEIEVMLTDFPGVRAAVVTLYGSGASQRLVAYLRLGEGIRQPTHSELRDHLRQDLPDYMVPSAYVFLDAFPLTPNRKINRKALPAPDLARPELANEYTPPRNDLETVLADIMSAVLDLDQVGVHDNFFELGGHSLQATRFVARAGKALRSEIPLWTFLRSPNVAEFAAELAEQEDGRRLLRVAELRVRMAQMSPDEVEQLLARKQGADS